MSPGDRIRQRFNGDPSGTGFIASAIASPMAYFFNRYANLIQGRKNSKCGQNCLSNINTGGRE